MKIISGSFLSVTCCISLIAGHKINQKALDDLIKKGKMTHSDALVVFYEGKKIASYCASSQPELIYLASITKSIVNLVFGLLITQGKLKSIDLKVSDFYPEWKQGKKRNITLRHILSHTSGLQDLDSVVEEINPAPDVLQLALAAELMFDPGSRYFYSNKAVNILSGIVHQVSGKALDVYASEFLFKPLGIKKFTWNHDKAGNPYANADLSLFADDLVKIGQLVLQKGVWNGQQLIKREWFDSSLQSSFKQNCHGLLWFLIPKTVDNCNGLLGYYAAGYRGQYLVIYPEKRLIGVRLIQPWSYKETVDSYEKFKEDLLKVVS